MNTKPKEQAKDCTHDFVTFSSRDGEICETCGKKLKQPLSKTKARTHLELTLGLGIKL